MARKGAKKQPVAVPRGLPYGQGQQLAEAQRAIPLPSGGPPTPPGRATGAPPTAQAGGGTGLDMQAAIQAAAMTAPPTPGRSLTSPTDRPGEPLTTGLPIGPGAGPEAMGLPAVPEEDAVLAALITAYQAAPNEALQRYIDIVRSRAAARHRTLEAGRQAQAQRRSATAGRPRYL